MYSLDVKHSVYFYSYILSIKYQIEMLIKKYFMNKYLELNYIDVFV